jgi:hypothetical protein
MWATVTLAAPPAIEATRSAAPIRSSVSNVIDRLSGVQKTYAGRLVCEP